MVGHGRCAGTIRILCRLAPAGKLLGIEPTLAAVGAEIGATEACGLDHGGQLVRCAPLLRRLAGGRHQLALFLPLTAPVVEGLCGDTGVAGDLGHALPVGRAHAIADLGPHGLVIDRFHGPR